MSNYNLELTEKEAENSFEEGKKFLEDKKFSDAIKKFEFSRLVFPHSPLLLRFLGIAYWNAGRKREALLSLSHARLLDPQNINIAIELIQLYASMGDFKSARSIAHGILSLNQSIPEVNQTISELNQIIDQEESFFRFNPKVQDLNGLKILFIAEPASIHAARWVNQFLDQGWDIHIASSVATSNTIRNEFQGGTIHISNPAKTSANLKFVPFPEMREGNEAEALAKLIDRIKPNLIHSLGLCVNWQNRCLPVAKALQIIDPSQTIPWIYSSWGADLDYFGLHMSDREDIQASLSRVNYYLTECERDLRLAREMGFAGRLMGKLPVFGGANWDKIISSQTPTATRKKIIIKGRDIADGDHIGRCMTIAHALLACSDVCNGYEIVFLQAGEHVSGCVSVLRGISGLDVKSSPHGLSHEDVIKLMSESRVMISLTINDGLPSFLTEAMSLGVFPIHSDLESIREWIQNGVNGILIPPDDVLAAVNAIRKALTDDALVTSASKVNLELADKKLAFEPVKNEALEIYARIVGGSQA